MGSRRRIVLNDELEKYILEAVKNIRNDRDITKRLLDDVMVYLSKDEQRHREVGITAAKYVETLQRSNEQLVKISTLLQKKETKDIGLSDVDKRDIFDIIQSGGIDE